MNKAYQLLVFDWDGTLMDSTARIVDSLAVAIEAAKLPVRTERELRHIIGLGLVQAIEYLFPEGIAQDQQSALVRTYREQYMASNPTPAKLYAGVTPMLQQLQEQGYDMSVATGKSRAGLRQALDITGLEAFFPITRCADETHSKPDPAMLHEIMVDHDIEPEQVLMIGDTEFDIEMGHRAGVDTVAVAQGAHTIEQLHQTKPMVVLDQITDLLPWLSNQA